MWTDAMEEDMKPGNTWPWIWGGGGGLLGFLEEESTLSLNPVKA